jgi:alpha-galactosidase
VPVVAFVGAGSAEFTRQLVSDLLHARELRGLELKLMDPNPERLRQARQRVAELIAVSGRTDVQVTVHANIAEAVLGAQYVINTVLVGGREAVRRDFDVLRRFDLRQTVGDTLGISGIFRAVRTIPQILDVVRAMEEAAPDAVLLNYTNPMSMLVMAVSRTTSLEHYGLCHSAYYTAETLAEYLGIPTEEMEWESCGINHMAWMLKLSHRGRDLYPDLRALSQDPEIWRQDAVRFEMMRTFGYFLTESSKHTAEYFPYFITHDDEVARLNIPLYEYLSRQRDPVPPVQFLLEPSGEYAPEFIQHRELNTPFAFQGNVANTPLFIENLPRQAAVEVPCAMVNGRVAPRAMGELPRSLAALNMQAVQVQDLTVAAVLEQDRRMLYEAVALDAQAGAALTLDHIRTLVDELLAANIPLVPPGLAAGL